MKDLRKFQLCHELFEDYVGADYILADVKIAQNYTKDPKTLKILRKHAKMYAHIERESKQLLKKNKCKIHGY